MRSRDDIDNLIKVLLSEDERDILLGIEVFNQSGIPRRKRRIFVQKLSESKKWEVTSIGGQQVIYRWSNRKLKIVIGPLDNL